jgi:putative aminopeptidase FrvX
VVGILNPDASYKVVIEAHADEISWLISRITDEGYIYVVRNGGSDCIIAPSMRAVLHGDAGDVEGVFGWPAIHVRHEKEITPTAQNIFIDIGAETKDEVIARGVHIGTVVTMEGGLSDLGDHYLTGRALDDRIGGFVIAEVARKLQEEERTLPFGLYIVNAVQEEVGCHGAAMIAQNIKPNVAICIDVGHDTKSPLYPKDHSDLKCGLGPILSYSAPIQNNLLNLIIETAQQAKIKFQREATARGTGTDTDAFAYAGVGIASALIGVPLKYMHTTTEVVHKDDVDATIELVYQVLLNINNRHDFRYWKV